MEKTYIISIKGEAPDKVLKMLEQLGIKAVVHGCDESQENVVQPTESKTDLIKAENELIKKITSILIRIGVSPKLCGFKNLAQAIELAVKNPEFRHKITTRLYPEVAYRERISAGRVERRIRHAIDTLSNNGRLQEVNKVLGMEIYQKNDHPTNSEFIALIAEWLCGADDLEHN